MHTRTHTHTYTEVFKCTKKFHGDPAKPETQYLGNLGTLWNVHSPSVSIIHTSAFGETCSISSRLETCTQSKWTQQDPTYSVSPWSNLQVTCQVLETCFSVWQENYDNSERLAPEHAIMVLWQEYEYKTTFIPGKKMSISLSHKALNWDVMGVKNSSSFLKKKYLFIYLAVPGLSCSTRDLLVAAGGI